MLVIRAYRGVPSPSCGPPLSIEPGEVVELMGADPHSAWWQVRAPKGRVTLEDQQGWTGHFPGGSIGMWKGKIRCGGKIYCRGP